MHKTVSKNMDKALWIFWYYNLADYEYDEKIFYKGPFEDLRCDDSYHDFLNNKLFPGIKERYVYMEDKHGNELTQIPTDLKQKVVVYFNPENLLKKMHQYLPKDTLEDHYLALEEFGWNVEALKQMHYESWANTDEKRRYLKAMNENPNTVVLMKVGKFLEAFHSSADVLHKVFKAPYMRTTFAHTGLPISKMDEYLKRLREEGYNSVRLI